MAEAPTSTANRIDALLPQTQCTRCGYPTCRAYADAIASQEADIDRCPPGGAEGVAALATLLGRAAKPLNPDYGIEQPPLIAVIDEALCIGCTKCIRACPVDAIVGAAKRMHTIIAAECTGCELCLPPCPVDCIRLVASAERPLPRTGVLERAARARMRYEARNARLEQEADDRTAVGAEETRARSAANESPIEIGPTSDSSDSSLSSKSSEAAFRPAAITRSAVLEAIARGRARRSKEPD